MSLMQRRRALMAAKKSRLPAEYQEVEWIGYDTNGRVLSTEIPLSDTQYVIAEIAKIAFPATNNGTVFPAMWNSNKTVTKWGTIENAYGSSWSCSPRKANTDLFDKTAFRSDKTTATGNGHTCIGYGSASYCPELRFYSLQVYGLNDTLLFNGVPCYKKSNNGIGMYDLASNKFVACKGQWQKGDDI